MSTYSLATGGTSGYPSMRKTGGVYKVEYKLDIAARIADGTFTTNLANGSVVELIEVPANTFVLAVGYQVTTALTATGTTTMALGDATVANGYTLAASVMSASATQVSSVVDALTVASPSTLPNNTEGYSLGKFYSAADTIDATFAGSSNTTVGVIKFWALMCDCNFTV